jgi:phosphatidylserine decarboxylase
MYIKKNLSDQPIVYYGWIYSLVPAGVGILVWLLFSWKFALFLLIPIAFILFFFRNPKRNAVASKNAIVSPADGKILSITKSQDDTYIHGDTVTVSIFLSIFSVHVNRSPISGRIEFQQYRPGKMLPAFKSHASDVNERNTIGIADSSGFKVLVHQITGFIARRIVCWVKPQENLEISQPFGLIKFGSGTDLVMPADTIILVRPGQSVKAGKTIIGEKPL